MRWWDREPCWDDQPISRADLPEHHQPARTVLASSLTVRPANPRLVNAQCRRGEAMPVERLDRRWQ